MTDPVPPSPPRRAVAPPPPSGWALARQVWCRKPLGDRRYCIKAPGHDDPCGDVDPATAEPVPVPATIAADVMATARARAGRTKR